jgi:type I restriction enzyme S subunit
MKQKVMMTNGWQEVSLGSLLTRIKDDVVIQDFEKYQRLTIRTNNKGIDIRDELEGHLIGTKNQYVVHGGQFLLSKIDAMNGAFGIVPEHVENGIITSNFWAYDVNEEKLFPKYFNYLTHTNSFQEFCIQASSGTTHRKYLREDLFLGMEIPLPPLTEQRRIVAHIESLAARVNEAQRLREEADIETGLLFEKFVVQVFDEIKAEHKKLSQVVLKKTGQAYKSTDFSENDGVPVVRLTEIKTKKPIVFLRNPEDYNNVWLEEGDIVFAKTSMATGSMCMWNNIKAVLNQNAVMLRANNHLDQKYLYYWLQQYVAKFLAKKLADPNYYPYIREGDLMDSDVPVPPLDEQRRIVAYLDGLQAKVNALRGLQSQSQEELDALLPSVLDRAFKGEL